MHTLSCDTLAVLMQSGTRHAYVVMGITANGFQSATIRKVELEEELRRTYHVHKVAKTPHFYQALLVWPFLWHALA